MKILEVRDGFIKFEADSSIYLSSFVQIDGLSKSYIAQVLQIKSAAGIKVAYAKILFLYDGSLLPYDKTIPSKESEIKEFTFDILSNSIEASNPIITGKTPVDDINITIDASAFDKKMLVSVDDRDENNILIRNFVKQFKNLNKNVVIIDTIGVLNAKKYTAGVDFKLPLDTASLAFMYEDCLNDATADSKAMIADVFRDLAEYSKTVQFVPFETLKSIVDEMVDKSHIFKLLVLKNKLAKLDKQGYFAKNIREVDQLEKILDLKCSVIDLSKLDTVFQNRYLAFIYEKLKTLDNSQIFLEISNVINKKNIKNILSAANVSTTFITHSKFKYLNDIKNVFDNFIITPSVSNNNVFNIYATFLNAMKKGTYLLAGEAVNYIPLVSVIKNIDETISFNNIDDTETSDIKTNNIAAEVADAVEEAGQDEENPDAILEQNAAISGQDEPDSEDIPVVQTMPEPEEILAEEAANISDVSLENIFAQDESQEPSINDENTENAEISEYSKNDDISGIPDNLSETSDIGEEEPDNLVITEEAPVYEEIPEVLPDTLSEITEEIHLETIPDDDIISEKSELAKEDAEETFSLEENFETEVHSETNNITSEIPVEITASEEQIEELQEETPVPEEILTKNFDDTEPNLLNEDITEETIQEPSDIEENSLQEDLTETIEYDGDLELDEELVQEDDSSIQQEVSIENENNQEISVMPISEDNSDFDEIVELNPDEADEDDIIIDMSDEEGEIDEITDEEIVKDVDKVFTTRKDNDISDSDLDFIDELNSDDSLEEIAENETEILEEQEDGIIEETVPQNEQVPEVEENEILETRNSSTPIVPVYDADIPQEDTVMSDPIQQGDTVFHAKYGSGIVEKMIKYGNKTLFSINFDNIGRRLLDPTLTEIKRA